MTSTPFHAYYTARILESLTGDDKFIPTFSSSDIEVYPYQVGAALFATRSPYSKGVVLMDEAGLGKSTEAMLVVTQKWYEGKSKIIIIVPNSDLLIQWEKLIENKYTIPYFTIATEKQLSEMGGTFEQDGIILTTFDFAVQKSNKIKNIMIMSNIVSVKNEPHSNLFSSRWSGGDFRKGNTTDYLDDAP